MKTSNVPAKAKDLTGQRIGKWTVLEFSHADQRGAWWLCECDCGTRRVVSRETFRRGGVKGCGCDPRPTNFIDLTGRKFGRLLILEWAYHRNGSSRWKCLCDCGKECVAYGSHMVAGTAQSCGCLRKELISERRRSHGLSKTSIYAVWNSLKARCLNPRNSGFRRYGGKGVRVCDRWRDSFEAFLEDVGLPPSPGLELDRIDPKGHYEPGNVRWVPRLVNCRNKANNRRVEFRGENLCVAEWAERTGLKAECIHARLNAGWSVERTLTEPRRGSRACRTSGSEAAGTT